MVIVDTPVQAQCTPFKHHTATEIVMEDGE